MSIQCPACKTLFRFDSSSVDMKKKTFKCSQCQHQWSVEKSFDDIPVTRISDLELIDRSSQNTCHNSVTTPNVGFNHFWYAVFSTVLACLTISLLIFNKYHKALLLDPRVKLSDVSIERSLAKKNIVVNYKISNNSSNNHPIPIVCIRIFDDKNKLVKYHILRSNKKLLYKNQHLFVQTRLDKVPDHIAKLDIAIGSSIQIAMLD